MGGLSPSTHFLTLPGGRRVAYCEYGDVHGKPVFYFHGTPGSRLEPAYGHQAVQDTGYRILAPDRPGIGYSEHAPSRSLLDWPADLYEMAQQFGFERFGVLGASGGGPYVLACAYAMPERLTFAVTMGSWGPVAAEPNLWQAMTPIDRFFGKISRSLPWLFRWSFLTIGLAARWLSPQGFMNALGSSMSDVDKNLMQDEHLARFYAEDVRESFRQGVRGPADDAMLMYRDWGFRLQDIAFPVWLFHGEEDHFAPVVYSETMHSMIRSSRLIRYPGEGHLQMFRWFGEILAQVGGGFSGNP